MKHIKTFENYDEESEHDIQTILDAYLECVIFTESGDGHDDGVDPFDGKTIYDFDNYSIVETRQQIEWFVDVAGDALDDISDESIGYDLWYTRNGHGVGFWDRGYDDDKVEILERLCKVLGYADCGVSKTGKIELYTTSNYKDFDLEQYKMERKAKKYNL